MAARGDASGVDGEGSGIEWHGFRCCRRRGRSRRRRQWNHRWEIRYSPYITIDLGIASFTLADQTAFATLSGDWNPLHVDAVAARRTLMGAPVVHGVHLVVVALERWLAMHPGGAATITTIRATFRKPAYLEREVSFTGESADGEIRINATADEGRVLELHVVLDSDSARDVPIATRAWPIPVPPDELSREAAASACGRLDLAIDAALARRQFGAIIERLGPAALAELLSTTRLVGMHCPGLHSLFAGFELTAHAGSLEPHVAFEVASAKLKYSTIALRVRGPGLAGTLDTFYRPPPTHLPMAEVIAAVTPSAYTGQRALVVGGTRGLGEAFAKAIAAGGGEVCLTYHRGAQDAARVVEEVRAAGFAAHAIALDATDPASLGRSWPLREPPTHLYYLATPTLFSIRKGAVFTRSELELMMRYFVTGLHATAAAAIALGSPCLVVWAPSTTMLDTPQGGVAYCAAKAAMEELGRHLPSMLPVTVHMPRLGRIDTDQTAGLITVASKSPLAAALEHLQR